MQNYTTSEENITENLWGLDLVMSFSYHTKEWFMKENSDKLDFTEIKNFGSAKDTIKRMKKKHHRLDEKICKAYTL